MADVSRDDVEESKDKGVPKFIPKQHGLHWLHKEVDASKWCVTLEDLKYFEAEVRRLWQAGQIPDDKDFPNEFHNDPKFGPTIYQVNEHYIKPTTSEAGGMSWALMRHKNGLQCDVFATHCWAEGVFEFLDKVRQAWPIEHDARNLYCCFLANPQCGGIDLILQDDNPGNSPFAKALRSAKHFLVIPNNKVSIYKRLWCVFEAHLAVEAARDRGLKIALPSTVPRWTVVRVGLPGVLSFIAGFTLGYVVMAGVYGLILGPLMWIVCSIPVSALFGVSARYIAPRCLEDSKVIAWTILNSYWFEMALIGHGLGLALWHLHECQACGANPDKELDEKIQRSFIPGEGWACLPLAIALLILYMSRIARQVSKSIAKREANLIDFTSVREADCTCPEDRQRIWKVIKHRAQHIDECIMMLSQAGRYDKALLANIENGMSARHAREGANPFRIFIAMWMWEYWWVVDLAAHRHHIYCLQVPVGSCVIVAILWYFARDYTIFAFDMAFYGGLAFVILSKLFVEPRYYEDGEVPMMTADTSLMQVLGMSLVVIASGYHYCGIRRRLWGRPGGNRWSTELAGNAQYMQCDDDSEVEEELAEIGEEFGVVECMTPANVIECLTPAAHEDGHEDGLSDTEEGSSSVSAEVDLER